jgi:hypothetical protein
MENAGGKTPIQGKLFHNLLCVNELELWTGSGNQMGGHWQRMIYFDSQRFSRVVVEPRSGRNLYDREIFLVIDQSQALG